MRYLTILVLMFCLGCAASAKKLNNIDVGMSKAEVIGILGSPDSTKAAPDVTVLEYRMVSDDFATHADPYWVVLRDGKVSTIGKAGDFGTLATPTQTIQVK